jgi:spermidine synthase
VTAAYRGGMDHVVVRRRDDGALELRVNGVFVMDDVETSSERLLARSALDAGARTVLVGGLGLGFTTRELLGSPDVESVVVAELHGEIVDLMRDGTIPGDDLLADPRLDVVVGDVREVVEAQSPGSLDAIVLDVDNGPDFLVHDSNEQVYRGEFVATCAERLGDDGLLSIWSMADSVALRQRLGEHFEKVRTEPVDVRLQGRDERYWILAGRRPRRAVRPTSIRP